jgi:hypothetical protein
MDKESWVFIRIMLFYIILSYVIIPVIFYYASGGSLSRAGDGSVVGSILSIILWYTYGSKMIKLK